MIYNDTIVAQSTPYGRSGVGIVRISGMHVQNIACKMLGGLPKARYAHYTTFLDYSGEAIDEGIAIWFPKPNSFTGEDVLELQGHGNPVILDNIIQSILCFDNVRIARPGEFSERAFLNGRIDLIQAESIIKLINAGSISNVKSALQSLKGKFSTQINHLINNIIEIRMLVEAALNFPEEDCIIQNNQIHVKLKNIFKNINNIYQIAKLGNTIQDSIKIVISGKTNVGKSTIFNFLSHQNTAIVTNIPGTTRDILREYIQIKGVTIQLIDTAGFRKTNNFIEKIGIRRTWEQIKISNYIFFVVDDNQNIFYKKKIISSFIKKIKTYKLDITIIINKCDLSNREPRIKQYSNGHTYIIMSAKSGLGADILRDYLQYLVKKFIDYNQELVFLARQRHINIFKLINKQVKNIKLNWFVLKNIELLAEDLKIVQNMLNKITGSVTSDDILKSIFKNFCIGK